jgi:hypothetical protein
MDVKSYGNKKENLKPLNIAKGVYKDIRSKVIDAGGRYHRSIYAVTNDLEIINISLKGAAVSEYSNFMDEVGQDYVFTKNWIEVAEAKEGKKGAVKFTSPVFSKSTAIKDVKKLQPFATTLQEYMNEYMTKPTTERVNSTVDAYEASKESEDEEELAF